MRDVKNRVIGGAAAIVVGLLTAIGPQLLFKICDQNHHMEADGAASVCYYTAKAAIAIGAVTAILGILYIVFVSRQIRAGFSIAIALNALAVFAIANFLIGVDDMAMMSCRMYTLPALNVISLLSFAAALVNAIWLIKKQQGVSN
jgi:hypothetical protein